MGRSSLQARWRLAPSATHGASALLTEVEHAVDIGESAFRSHFAEPRRGAWWGRLATTGGDLFVKARRLEYPRQRWASIILPRGLVDEWRQSLWYLEQGLPCAVPVALGEYRTLGMLDLSVMAVRWVPDSRPLREAAPSASPPERRRLIGEAGALVGRLFRHGAIHRQPHPGNFLVAPAGASGGEIVIPVDLQHLWISPGLTDDDFLWALGQISFWLHEPVIDWSDREAARLLYGAAIGEAQARLANAARVRDRAEGFVERGRDPVKRRRHQWSG